MAVNRLNALLTAVNAWYRAHARALPWRVPPEARAAGATPDPYRVWLSEIMLQQTTVAHAGPYFERFSTRWPSVDQLAAAEFEEVSDAWAGLGYYSRARRLHACAQTVAARGGFPQDPDGLRALPGVGPYTAAAVAAICFDRPIAPVDGNIERVVARLFALGTLDAPPTRTRDKQAIAEHAQALFDERGPIRAGDLAQALMDLGALVCTPRRPNCSVCPLEPFCAGRASGAPERYPVKPAKRLSPVRHGTAFVAVRRGEILLVRRPPEGLLGGMLMPPTGPWDETPPEHPLLGAPAAAAWEEVGEIRHVFTHFSLRLAVWRAELGRKTKVGADAQWLAAEAALKALPTVGRKAVKLALG